MRYEKGHSEATRQHIIDVASRRFREHGVAGVGLSAVMSDAGLTNGAFYTHFESKEELFRQVLLDALGKRKALLRETLDRGRSLEDTIRSYLSARHRDRPGNGCTISALVAEVARHPKPTREIFTSKIEDSIDLMAAQLPARSAAARRQDAIALYGMMVGTLQLARAVSDTNFSDEILESGIEAALAFIQKGVGSHSTATRG
jgi:TetR/AcrR family transcriptional regulator, transcriptional repressor for nem operon